MIRARRKERKTLKDFDWLIGAKVLGICTVLGTGFAYASQRYVIGLDTQDTRCLDEWFFVIDTWARPSAAEVRLNDYIAVALTPEQTPPHAKWKPGHVMVKRAVATRAGDRIEISGTGAMFSHGAEAWRHGTALEAAPALGLDVAALTREIVLEEGELFLMGDHPMSYDGRYYGQVDEEQIVGAVLWAF
ncbi:S26 family signal peptidase [Paracoccus sp. 1_MG-2023]|uniref:S26 family signal peptidase n=1 Tax=unclassified Paracoccus (in: a-proteobacteria) TaxID=2688777 RepID=UPI001C09BE5D|nr:MULTISPECIES: S26 family signal peptidase [unclassified Paracoccus (in: a-proteobacteria)]MBU2959149.1 S26 family signal peptidase [Paracoccus sp. C2R09]MDO6669432.1 S26 family signal peptidase [Paracoccus sp. 1_MG-2023]